MKIRKYLDFFGNSLPWHLFLSFLDTETPLLMLRHSSNGLLEWLHYETVIKQSKLTFLLCFITLGHFLLLSSSPTAEDSGTCEYHFTSPVLPGSDEYCIFQVALYEAGPAVGNLTLMIQPILSSSAVRSVVLNRRNHDNRRSANRPFLSLLRFLLFIFLRTVHAANTTIELASKSRNPFLCWLKCSSTEVSACKIHKP